MGYTATRRIEDLFDAEPIDRAARRIAERWQTLLLERVAQLTPVSAAPEGVSPSDFRARRGGRRPGRLRDSWARGEVTVLETAGADTVRVTVETDDPVAPYVEYPTRPHTIRPRADRAPASVLATRGARQRGAGARLRFYVGSRVVYAREVRHPGTQGAFMLQRAVAEMEGRLRDIAVPELNAALREAYR